MLKSSSRLTFQEIANISATIGQDQVGYHIINKGGTFQTRLAGQGTEVEFTPKGLSIFEDSQFLGINLVSYGRGENLVQSTAGLLSVSDNLVEYSYGYLKEKYINGPSGLEQLFSLEKPPSDDQAQPLSFYLNLTGNWQATVNAEHTNAAFMVSEKGGFLQYTRLTAIDARGRTLSTWLEGGGSNLQLNVADDDATYPVQIEAFLQDTRLLPSDPSGGDQLGYSIAISGDTVVAGAPNYCTEGACLEISKFQGAAYVFVKPNNGWVGDMWQSAKLIASDRTNMSNFGRSVDIQNDTIVVGAYNASPGDLTNAGEAYVFIKPTSGWAGTLTENARLTASDKTAGDHFGQSVAIIGDNIAVGSPDADLIGASDAGAVYMFNKPASGWSGSLTEVAKLHASDKADDANFGWSIDMDESLLVVGALNASPGDYLHAGAAYVFVMPGEGWSGNLTQSAELTADDKAAGDNLGCSISLNEDTIAVGAYNASSGGTAQSGSGYVFVKPVSGWSGILTQSAKLTAMDKTEGSYFGYSISINGNVIAIGSPFASLNNYPNSGVVYLFVRPTAGWSGILVQNTILMSPDTSTYTMYGSSVVVAEGTIVTGALGGWSGSGRVYVSTLPALASLSPTFVNFSNQTVGSPSSPFLVMLSNTGYGFLTIENITASGDFLVSGNTCINNQLEPGGSCEISVVFTPAVNGVRTGLLVVSDNAANGGIQIVPLTGTGIIPVVSFSPAVVNFGNQQVSHFSPTHEVTLTNNGTADLAISSIATSPSDFSQTNNCGITLGVGSSCTINLTFTPSQASVRLGKLTLTDNASGSPHMIELVGTGTTSPMLSPTSISFGIQAMGTSSAAQTVQLTNLGGAMMGITGITVEGDYHQTNTCVGFSLPVGSSCTIDVAFSPTYTGTRNGIITVTVDTGVPPISLNMNGTGEARIYLPIVTDTQ